ncbi:MAG: hypothetical protein QNK04_05345 [Myxococcota bacterium]|nr:hypothetical protein [Myxococcota bacterium]
MVVDFAFPLLLLLVGGVVGALYLREKRRKEAWQLQGADQADDLRVPHFFARRQIALFDWLGRTFGGQDIDFPQDEAFSTAFVLQGEDEAATRELFAPSLRQALLRHDGTSLQLEGRGDTLVLHWGRLVEPETLRQNLDTLIELTRRFPSARSW